MYNYKSSKIFLIDKKVFYQSINESINQYWAFLLVWLVVTLAEEIDLAGDCPWDNAFYKSSYAIIYYQKKIPEHDITSFLK